MIGKIIITIIIVFLVLLLLSCVIGFWLANFIVHPAKFSYEQGIKSEEKRNNIYDYHELKKEDYQVTMSDGYKIATQFIPAEEDSRKFVIITHGYGVNRIGALKYLHIFHQLGFNCIIYDDRGHGMNEPAICSLSLWEHKDLLEMISDTFKRYGGDISLGLHGESMGAAMTAYAIGENPDVDFAVLDCPFADLFRVTKHKAKQMFHLPSLCLYPADAFCKLLYGFRLTEVRPIDGVAKSSIPILYMHGYDDDFIDYRHSERMHSLTKEHSELHLFPGANHALSYDSDKEGYTKIVKEFIEKVYEKDEFPFS